MQERRRLGLFTLQNCVLALLLALSLSAALVIHVVLGGGEVVLFRREAALQSAGVHQVAQVPDFQALLRKFEADVERLLTLVGEGQLPSCVVDELHLVQRFLRQRSCSVDHEEAAKSNEREDFEHHEGDVVDDALDDEQRLALLRLLRKEEASRSDEERQVLQELRREQPAILKRLQAFVKAEEGFEDVDE